MTQLDASTKNPRQQQFRSIKTKKKPKENWVKYTPRRRNVIQKKIISSFKHHPDNNL